MANRFEQVDQVVGDAVTLVLSRGADGQRARVICPKSAHESLAADRVTEPMLPSHFATTLTAPPPRVASTVRWARSF